ncbi:MAG: YkvA family protein [Marinobacter sp.]|nr:YkvA family protein [Marinobacter sp.]
MPGFSRKQARRALDHEAGQVKQDRLESLLERQKAIEDKVKNSGRLKRFGGDIRLMFSMLKDYWQGHYRAIPWKSVAAIAGALIYVLNPLDLIPDMIFGFGLLDDAGVVAACLSLVESDLIAYAAWKESRDSGDATAPDKTDRP